MRRLVVIVTGLFLMTVAGFADDLLITSFSGNGEVTWTYPTNGVREYRVEWCSDLTQGLWCDLESGTRGIAPTGGTMTASVPMFYRMKALGPEPTNMVYIPAGWFDMGNCMDPDEGWTDELPVHPVYVSGFYIDQYEVSSNLWGDVLAYALVNGYTFEPSNGSAKGTDHPVHTVNWYDCVKWANARSQKEGLTPCYYADTNHTVVYKSGDVDLTEAHVDWTADGYRLPTEAEWEKAARGGATGHRFPWADDTIQHSRANYWSDPGYAYDISPTPNYHPDYDTGATPYTSPVGAFTANGYGLYDVSGNLYEWCWDRKLDTYYTSLPAIDPRGPESGSTRVIRGGYWSHSASQCRVSDRTSYHPGTGLNTTGCRLVRTMH